jgi:hypothetical protein
MVNIVVRLDGFSQKVMSVNPKTRLLKTKHPQKHGESFK